MDIYVPYGASIYDLMDKYGAMGLANGSTFTVECTCGNTHTLEPDGHCTCECGLTIQSPLLQAGII